MVSGEDGQRLQAITAGGDTPCRVFIEKRIRLGKQITRRLDPESEFVEQREGMVGAVCHQQNRAVQVRVQCRKQRQSRGAWKPQAGEGFPCLKSRQQLLVGNKFPQFI